MTQLTCVPTGLEIPNSFTQQQQTTNTQDETHHAPTSAPLTIPIPPYWLHRLGWNVDQPVLACRRIQSPPSSASSSSSSSSLSFHCSILRVVCLDPVSSPSSFDWSLIDLASVYTAPITVRTVMTEADWNGIHRVQYEPKRAHEEHIAYNHRRRVEYESSLASAASAAAASAAAAASVRTPVKTKTKQTLMQLPSAFAKSPESTPTMKSPECMKATITNAARLTMKLMPLTTQDDGEDTKLEDSILLFQFRSSSSTSSSLSNALSSPTSTVASLGYTSTINKCTRLVLKPIRRERENDSSHALTKDVEMDYSAMMKRTLIRQYLCKDARISLAYLDPCHRMSQSQVVAGGGWKDVYVAEISPAGEISQVTRQTNIVFDTSIASAIVNPSSTPTTSSQHKHLNNIPPSLTTSSTMPQSDLHPALAALHALLLPPLLYPQAFEYLHIDTPKGLLLIGPPGVGKSYSVGTVCRDLNLSLFLIDGSNLFRNSIAGEAEEKMRNIFKEARECKTPAVLFIDEMDVLCPHRTTDTSQLTNRLVAQLLSLMDGLEDRGQLLIVGATNHPNTLDAALRRPGRFDRELRLDPPDVRQREQLLHHLCRQMPIGDDSTNGREGEDEKIVDGGDRNDIDVKSSLSVTSSSSANHQSRSILLRQVAERTIGYVAADLAALVREAAQCAFKQMRIQQQQHHQHHNQSSSSSPHRPSITLAHFESAQLIVPASSLRSETRFAVSVSSTGSSSFDAIGGLEDVKLKLFQSIDWPLKHSATFRQLGLRPPRGLLLHGPPGCAKTSLVRAIARRSQSTFLPLDTATLYSAYVGEAERILRTLFTRARANRPCIIFLDELDAIVSKRDMTGNSGGGGSSSSDTNSLEARILSTLLNEMDGMVSSNGILIVAATNRLDMIDEALLRPGRFDQIIYVPPPDSASRLSILQLHSQSMLANSTSPETCAQLRQLAAKLDYFTGADIANLCRETAMAVLRKNIEQEKIFVSDLCATAATFSPSLTQSMVESYEKGRMKQ